MDLLLTVFSDTREKNIIWSTEASVGLRFGTQLPGGFSTCEFTIPVKTWEAVRLYRLLLNCHVVVFDKWGRRVYEGRIETVSLASSGVGVSATGYYALAQDRTAWTTFRIADDPQVQDLIFTAVDLLSPPPADLLTATGLWSPDMSFLQANATPLGGTEDYEFMGESKVVQMIEKALAYPADTVALRPMHFAIWEHRKAHYFAEPDPATGYYDWAATVSAVDSNFSLERSLKDVYNKIQAVYDDSLIGQTFYPLDGWLEDKSSQALFGLREGTMNLGSASEGLASVALDFALQNSAYPEQSTSFDLVGKVKNRWGVEDALYMVRAGQMLRVDDFDPAGIQLLSGTGGKDTAIAFIQRTEYSADDKRLSIELGHRNVSMDLLMARLGLSSGGGLS